MRDPIDEHLDKAFASLDEYTVRELEATAEAIGSRRHPLHGFASIFRGVAHAREGGWSTDIARFTSRRTSRTPTRSSSSASLREAPFWKRVREALAERHS